MHLDQTYFEKLLIDHAGTCFDEGIHEKVLEKFPESDFIQIVSDKSELLDEI